MTSSVVVVVGGTVDDVVVGASVVVVGGIVVAGAVVVTVVAVAVVEAADGDVEARTVERGTLSAGDATTDLSADAHDVARARTTNVLAATERERAREGRPVRVALTAASFQRSYDVTKLASYCRELAAQAVLSRDCHTSLCRYSR
jgi:hypothetical protein